MPGAGFRYISSEMDTDLLSQRLKALGDPTRLRILEQLPSVKKCEDVYNVSELAEELHIPQPTVSHHLRVLANAGLVQCEKMCRDVYYWIDRPAVDAALKELNTVIRQA